MPDARPASCGATWPSAVADATTNSVPVPAAATATPITMRGGAVDQGRHGHAGRGDEQADHAERAGAGAPDQLAGGVRPEHRGERHGRKSSPVVSAPWPR